MDRVAEEREALINQLMNRIAMERQKAEVEGEQIIDHTFQQAIILIVTWLVGYVIARLLLHRLLNK